MTFINIKATLLISFGLLFHLIFSSYAYAESRSIKRVKGEVVCIEINEDGNLITKQEYSSCEGLLVLLGMDNKIYTISGTEGEIDMISKSPKRVMGSPVTLKLRGLVIGNQRAWRLQTSTDQIQETKATETSEILGTIYCLIPKYSEGNVKPMVAMGPCDKIEPHSHVLLSDKGVLYAIHGKRKSIEEIEKSSNRKGVTFRGAVYGNKSGWILFVQ